MRMPVFVVAVLLLAAPVFAADVDGKWSGTLSSPNGELPVTFEFKADGATLTGTTLGFDGSKLEIKNGTVDGQNIAFVVTFDFGGMALDVNYKGVVSSTEIKITAEAMGMPIEFVLKKS
jgi:hypothetical protein